MSTMEQWAQYYRAQGLSVIPVSGKMPLIKWAEFQERCASEEEIKTWWKKWPEADIGMVTGEISNRFVLDIDGAEAEQAIFNFNLPLTQCVKTKRGRQIHFRYPGILQAKTTLVGVLPNLDTRGEGGYVKLPPSIFSDQTGRYEWQRGLEVALAECPQWLLGLLIEKNKPRQIDRESGESWLSNILNGIKDGNRNASFTSIAGSLRSRGYSASDIYLFLADKAESVGFDLSELRTVCNSVGSYAQRVQPLNQEAQSVSDFLADEQKVEWIVPGLIAKRSISFIHGMPQVSKSWVVLDLAVECARGGGLWLEKFPTKKAKVLFVEQERFRGETQRRIKAVLSAKGLDSATLPELYIQVGTTTRINLQQSFDAFRKRLGETKPDLVIVDSWATFHTVKETDRMAIQVVLENIKSLREEFECAFFFVNHDTKQSLQHQPGESKQPSMSDMQGNTAIAAVAEMMLSVKRKDDETCMVYNVKNTLAQSIEPFSVSVVDTDTGIVVRGS